MNNRISPNSKPHRRRLNPIPLFVLGMAGALLSGCKPPREGAAATPSPSASAEEHIEGDGHDHGAEDAPHVDEVTLTSEAVSRYDIRTDSAQLWALRPTAVAPARVAFNTEAMAHVGSPLRGRVVEVSVRLGDEVTAGQSLVVIESPELGEAQADLLLQRSAVLTAGPAVELTKVAWDRARGLYEQSQSISLTEVQRREAEHKAAITQVKSAEAAATASENRLHLLGMKQEEIAQLISSGEIAPRYVIRAAIDGQVVHREVTLGELVGPDREYLMVLADTSTLWVLADVAEATLTSVTKGAQAWVTIGSGSGEEERRFEGSVAFIAPQVDPTTRTAQVRIDVPVTELALKPGMFAQAEIVLSAAGVETPPVIAVPAESIQTVEGEPAVFVPAPNEPNTFLKRAVSIGSPVGGLVPVYSGLLEGERFVVSGTFILKAELGKGSAAHEH